MRVLGELDERLLRACDGAVAWAWRRLSLPRAHIVRFLALAFVIGALSQAFAMGQPWAAAALGGITLAGWTLLEWRDGRIGASLRNAQVLATRRSLLNVVLRYGAVCVAALPPWSPANVVSGACLAALLFAADTLSPDGPPAYRKTVGRGELATVKARR